MKIVQIVCHALYYLGESYIFVNKIRLSHGETNKKKIQKILRQ